MATEFAYNFSWHTAIAIVVSIASSIGLRYLLKKRHPREYEALCFEGMLIDQQENITRQGRSSSWFKPDNSKYHLSSLLTKWLLTFGFLKLNDFPFTIYCFFTQASAVTTIYFVLTDPIFAEWANKL